MSDKPSKNLLWYAFPELGVSVQAESYEDAQAQVKKLTEKK